jgi:cellobiose-specific phosphotransferase system component IIC
LHQIWRKPSIAGTAIILTMDKQDDLNEITQLQTEWNLKAAQMNLARAEEQLILKKVRWYECVMFGGAGLTLGLALAKIFLDLA